MSQDASPPAPSLSSEAISGDQFRKFASRWLTGVTVVTSVTAAGEPVGLTMSAVSPLSLSPPQFLACLDLKSDTLAAVRESGVFCINILREDQAGICGAFARKKCDKFMDIVHRPGKTGAPILADVLAYIECRVAAIHESGDHAIVIGSVCGGDVTTGEPLGYFASSLRLLAGAEA